MTLDMVGNTFFIDFLQAAKKERFSQVAGFSK